MLDTRFPRGVGDIGNPATFDFPVRYKTAHGASPQRVVRERDPALLRPFIDAGRVLVADHPRAADAPARTPVEGITAGSAFQQTLLQDQPPLDTDDALLQVVGAAQRLLARHPALTDIVLECTHMPPYADAVRRAIGPRVRDITTLIGERFHALPH